MGADGGGRGRRRPRGWCERSRRCPPAELGAPNGTGEGVEGATHVDQLDRHEHAYGRRQAQHDRRASSTRRSVSARTSSPNSSSAPMTRSVYRAALCDAATSAFTAGTSSTRRLLGACRVAPPARADGPFAPRARLIFRALRERPSTPWARATAPWSPPDRAALASRARASFASTTFRCSMRTSLRLRPHAVAAPVIPASLSGHGMDRFPDDPLGELFQVGPEARARAR